MIFVEPNELKSGLYDGIPYTTCDHLEEWTGADLMISARTFPVNTEALVRLHVKSGAVLVQRKSGMDLVSSFGYRLNSSLERMRSFGAYQSQCVLLFIGSMEENTDGKVVINGYTSDYTMANIIGAFEGWIERGGIYSTIPNGYFEKWLAIKDYHLGIYLRKKIHYIYPEPPIQQLEKIDDWRYTVAAIPSIGPVKANAVYDALAQTIYDNNLLNALVWLTDGEHKINGIGKETIRSVRQWVGIPDGWNISLDWKGDNDNG